MSEIRKISKNRRDRIGQPKIIGAQPVSESRAPNVLDHNTKQKPLEIQTKQHGETVTVSSHTRRKPKKSDPDVRLQVMSREDREAWRRVKTNEWEQ